MSWQVQMKLAWIRVARVGARLLLSVFQWALFQSVRQRSSRTAIRRILVYRIGNIGDILVTLPTLSAIRTKFPDAHIALLTSPGQPGAPGAEHILPMGEWYDELLVYFTPDVRSWKGGARLLNRLREGKFDLFIELPNQQSRPHDEIRNMIVARLAGCRHAVGFAVSQHALFLREQTLLPQVREAERIYRSVSQELSLDRYQHVPLPVADARQDEVGALFLRLGITESEPFVVMHAGAKRQTNQWPAERYARVADEIIGRWRTRIILTGSQSELPLIEYIVERMREKPTVLCGQIDLPQMTALLKRSCLYVGNDTGPMHLAAAVGTPTVSIFSARDFEQRWYPVGLSHEVLRRDAPCSPCFKEVCDQDLICLRGIEVDDVLSAVERQFTRRDLRVAVEAK
jgi:ADP-heptose:LPS heptosyltransferase